jgi:hypothetical protein
VIIELERWSGIMQAGMVKEALQQIRLLLEFSAQ